MKVRKKFLVDEVAEVIPCQCLVMIERAVFVFGSGPALPPIRLIEDEGVFLPLQRRFRRFVFLQPVKVFEKQEPRSLFGVIEFRGATGFFSENVVNVPESLFEHSVAPQSIALVASTSVSCLCLLPSSTCRIPYDGYRSTNALHARTAPPPANSDVRQFSIVRCMT
jgi:hypothetical protein